jgi:hypothetical protein
MDLHKCICALSLGFFLFMTVIRRKPFLNILCLLYNKGIRVRIRGYELGSGDGDKG